ncbi:YAP1-binding protein 1 [Fusarium falciforme]|uniref:YAP1-binding protein 1 n=1 Tax=Fusarium falciforme TaxID=195108 RepID=A0A9W8RDB9_9HYPO|nr:YAP1-binding protein 1 [Fusarium falciforme]KAJ4202925.1 YAP1-binding protein 1 [Fusarium falciforme]
MVSVEEAIKRLQESRPPATDAFTYLTIVETHLSPEVLPALHDILEDSELTNDIGWDLVEMLISVPGSETCLETIARLGNPREVIIKVLEVLDSNSESAEAGDASASAKFITLVGMLSILHRRLQVKAPSRFLHSTLQTVYRAYNPRGAETTAAVIDLVRSLSGRKRPPLPTRQSSTKLETPFQETDLSKSAPDPEADAGQSPGEPELVARLLQSFITSILEAYVNSNSMEWASRLLEYCTPEKIVPGRPTMLQAFKQVEELQARDALVGQLVAVARDLGLSKMPSAEVKKALEAPISKNPLSVEPDPKNPDAIKLSTGGFLCLTAYRMFASDIFDADYDQPDVNIFPEHHTLLKRFLGDEPQAQIVGNPGTVEALIVIALWLNDQKRLVGPSAEKGVNFMSYHHLLTLVSVFHPSLRVRNAATVMAGLILHSDPDEEDRLSILEDLLENCMFSSLQACAVTWLREEMIAARKAGSKGRFATPECLDGLQYTLFQDLVYLNDTDSVELWEYWVQNAPFHLQVANFALFLFGGQDYKDLAPAGMAAAIEHRYVNPLLSAAKKLREAVEKKELDGQEVEGEVLMQLGILTDTLERVPLQ